MSVSPFETPAPVDDTDQSGPQPAGLPTLVPVGTDAAPVCTDGVCFL
ncbi:hypothetical protein [Nonomuraea sp. JJY05]|jgi:hypothetical protein